MNAHLTGLIVDLLGFVTGTVLYGMLTAMAWREQATARAGDGPRRGLLPLATGACGLVWNVGALLSFAPGVADAPPSPVLVAVAFGALGFLPAVVVHSLLEGRETALRGGVVRPAIVLAYTLSTAAAALHLVWALRSLPVPSRPALWLSTAGFGTLAAALLLATRRQPMGRRGIWFVGLSVFAVSVLHFTWHTGTEAWWVELLGHQASLPLALAILLQDYRFALADLFLKNAIAILILMAVSLAAFSGAVVPLVRGLGPNGQADPRAVAAVVVLWMVTALVFPLARRFADRFVDRVVLRRPDYAATVTRLADDLERAETDAAVMATTMASITEALGATDVTIVEDPRPEDRRHPVLVGSDLRMMAPEGTSVLLRLGTVTSPHPAIAVGPLGAGRRLLSDDQHLLEAIGRIAARRLDGLRVANERLERDLLEQRMRRLASEAELQALRAQIHPHFLFNALTTIGHLIQEAPPRALETLLRLTSVLRGVLRRTATEFSTVGEEIALVRAYLDIEQARFDERLRVDIDVPDAVRAMALPALLLQPLVENAIKHGLGPTRDTVVVRLTAALTGDVLTVTVRDTGRGFDPGTRASGGIGLRHVADRLRVHYGDRGRLDIESTPGVGTQVSISLPVPASVDIGSPT